MRRTVGRDVLRSGGNAVDAAIATAFALAVTLPGGGEPGRRRLHRGLPGRSAGGGDGGFPRDGPQAATPRMYLDREGKLRPRHRAGAWAAGVPGTVRGLGLAHARWGKLPWADLVRPAVGLAREGFPISASLAGSLNSQLRERTSTSKNARSRTMTAGWSTSPSRSPRSARPDRAPWKAGDRLIQRDLAATLEQDRHRGRRRVLHRADRRADRPVHGGEGWADHRG